MSEDTNKKQVKNGPKISVLIGVNKEIGNPHPIKKGSEMNDINSWSCILLSND